MQYQIVKRHENFLGLDLRSSDVTRPVEAASTARNAQIVSIGGVSVLSSRKGFKVVAPSYGGYGLAKYLNINTSTGIPTGEILAIGSKLYRLTQGTISIEVTGAGAVWFGGSWFGGSSWSGGSWFGGGGGGGGTSANAINCSILVIDDTWHFTISEDGVEILDYDLGIGVDEASPTTLNDLSTQVNALTNYTMTVTGDSTTAAAYLPSLYNEPFESGALEITYTYWVQVPQPTTAADPFANLHLSSSDANFENASWVNSNNVLYVSSAYDELRKYDGQKVYRAGMPQGSAPTASVVANATGRTGTNIKYRVTFIQYDAKGNVVEGIISDESNAISPAADYVDVSFAPILNSTGFNTDAAMVAGAQALVNTITCDNGAGGNQSLKAGDIAYFFDSVSNAYVERTITAVTNSSITISGAPVTVADNIPISANLRVALWAQSSAGGSYFLVDEYPNNPYTNPQVIRDLGGTLAEQYIEPVLPAELPPKGRYITTHQGLLCITGQPTAPNRVSFQDVDLPEGFPSQNTFECQAVSNEPNSGIASSNEFLVIFKPNAYFIVSGKLTDAQFRVDLVSTGVGCHAHASIADVRGSIVFLGRDMVYRIAGGGLPEPIGLPISPVFVLPESLPTRQLVLKRAIAADDPISQLYILCVPCEETTSDSLNANSNTRTFVWDYFRDAWYEWKNINAAGGLVIDGLGAYWVWRRYSTSLGQRDTHLFKRMMRNDQYDQVDHTDVCTGVDFEYAPGWEALGEPSVYKKFLRVKFFTSTGVSPSFEMRIRTEKDYTPNVFHSDFNIEFGGDDAGNGYGFTPYGSNFGDPTAPATKNKLREGKAMSLRYNLTHSNLYEVPYITGWETEIVAPFRPAIKD